MHRISFLFFVKYLFDPSIIEGNRKLRMYIFLGSDCSTKQGDGVRLP